MADDKSGDTTPTEAELKAKADADAKAAADKTEADKKNALDAEIKAKEDKKANLDKAILEAEDDLRKKRDAKKETTEISSQEVKIDLNDPGAKAWDKHIDDKIGPVAKEVEKEKAEIRSFALRDFLADKPALATNSEKLKELISVYDRIKTATERTKEGVLLDLNKAFAAIYSEQLIDAARSGRVERAKEMELFSAPAIDSGATGYSEDKAKMPHLSAEDKAQLAKWNITPEQWAESQRKRQKTE